MALAQVLRGWQPGRAAAVASHSALGVCNGRMRMCFPTLPCRMLCLAAVTMTVPPASAADDERVTIRLDGRAVIRVGGQDDLDPAERAARIERRLARILDNPRAIAPTRVEHDPEDPAGRIVSVAIYAMMISPKGNIDSPSWR